MCDRCFLRLPAVFILGTGGAEMYPGQTQKQEMWWLDWMEFGNYKESEEVHINEAVFYI